MHVHGVCMVCACACVCTAWCVHGVCMPACLPACLCTRPGASHQRCGGPGRACSLGTSGRERAAAVSRQLWLRRRGWSARGCAWRRAARRARYARSGGAARSPADSRTSGSGPSCRLDLLPATPPLLDSAYGLLGPFCSSVAWCNRDSLPVDLCWSIAIYPSTFTGTHGGHTPLRRRWTHGQTRQRPGPTHFVTRVSV